MKLLFFIFNEIKAHNVCTALYANKEFSEYVKRNSGNIDSETSDEVTTYYFDVKATAFEEALRQFVELFKEINVTEEDLEEIITDKIYAEAKRIRQTANYRLSQLFKWSICSSHIMTKDKYGSLHTLYEGPKARRYPVLEYFKRLFPAEYGSTIMSLCITGKGTMT